MEYLRKPLDQRIWLLGTYCRLIDISIERHTGGYVVRIIQIDQASSPWNIRYTANTLRPRQNGRHFADDIFMCIFLNEDVWIPMKISMKFVPKGPINNIPALVRIMAWRRPGDKPLSEPMMVSLKTHICVIRPQWVNFIWSIGWHQAISLMSQS